ncbi:MAG TPA: uL13 family ribosomal protein [Candidatus Paceibacterota bacterium]
MSKTISKKPEPLVIDATGMSLGRVASMAAKALRGKDSAAFQRHTLPGVNVKITNAKSMRVLERKLINKKYARYSGYPGGLRFESLQDLVAAKGYREAIREAIHGMIPNNKLRPEIMKNLTITE